ncbi:MAG TPA: hypothetical protein ENJ95_03600 [Bacteroidetes bacterium]|nr:hypothetical protein [Bacteroidota bacterium]
MKTATSANSMTRHICTICSAKRTEGKLTKIYSPVFKKSAWICTEHASTGMDVFSQRNSTEKPLFLELFSGSGHIAAAAQQRGFKTVTVDVEAKFSPDICIDICNLRRSVLPERVDIIWASIPCTVYSILNLANHWQKTSIGYRRYYYSPKTPQALEALRILAATIRLIKKLQPIYYFIENPRGALRHMPHMAFVPYRRHVHYSDYGFDYPKPTDIFTNCPHFTPIKPTNQRLNGHAGLMSINSPYERSLIPPALIDYLMDCIQFLATPRLPDGQGSAHVNAQRTTTQKPAVQACTAQNSDAIS